MLVSSLSALAIPTLALATTQLFPGVKSIGTTLSNIKRSSELVKRQDLGALAGFASLSTDATIAVATNGECSSECTPWVTAVESCSDEVDTEAIGKCACQQDAVESMVPCGSCLGSEGDVSDFEQLCKAAFSSNGAESSATSIPSLSDPPPSLLTTDTGFASPSTTTTEGSVTTAAGTEVNTAPSTASATAGAGKQDGSGGSALVLGLLVALAMVA